MRRIRVHILILTLASFALFCCESSPRGYGYYRLGKPSAFKPGYTFLEDKAILVIYDERGFAAMSTYSPYDRSQLILVKDAKGEPVEWRSDFSESRYEFLGKAKSGPATKDLFYHQIVLDQGDITGLRDTLYVKMGSEKSPEWRFVPPVPTSAPAVPATSAAE